MGRRGNNEGSVRQLPDGQWECVIQSLKIINDQGRAKRIKRRGKTQEEAIANAKRALKQAESNWYSGNTINTDKSRTFGSYMEQFVEDVVKPNIAGSTHRSYVKSLRINFYNYPISNYQLHVLNADVFGKYYNSVLETKAMKTLDTPRQLCMRCCAWLKDVYHLIDDNYAEEGQYLIKKEIIDEFDRKIADSEKARKKIFTSEDIEKFYYAFENNMGEYPVVVLFLLETGMRAQEFAALKIDDVDFENNKIHIRQTIGTRFKFGREEFGSERYDKVPKNREERYVKMTDLSRDCAKHMIEQTKLKCSKNEEGYLYPTFRNGKARTNSTMELCFQDLCNRLGVDRDVRYNTRGGKKGLSLHALRYTYVSIANGSEGGNFVNTAKATGHKIPGGMQDHYTQATDEGLESIPTAGKVILHYKSGDSPEKKIVVQSKDKKEEAVELLKSLKEDKELLAALKELISELK